MIITEYRPAHDDQTTVTVTECIVAEIACDCGAQWLHGFHPAGACPYCGDDDQIDVGDGLPSFDTTLVEQAGADAYARDIRGIVRALWSGALDYDQAFALMLDTVRIGLTSAYHEGASECGVQPSELTPTERIGLARIIADEQSHIAGFLDYVQAHNKASGDKLAPMLGRAEAWGLRYYDVYTRARLIACADRKLEWMINHVRVVKENCDSCLRLNGKVKRASYWKQHEVQPQNPPNPKLKCGGWKCGCGLVETDKPLSRGPLPRLP